MLQDKKATWRHGHNFNNWFFKPQEKKISMLRTIETTIFIHDSQNFHTTQTTISLIHSKYWCKQPRQLFFNYWLNYYAHYLQSTATLTTSLISLCKKFDFLLYKWNNSNDHFSYWKQECFDIPHRKKKSRQKMTNFFAGTIFCRLFRLPTINFCRRLFLPTFFV